MKLEIEGKVVEVDDSFGGLSPEKQQSTVEDIARQMRGGVKETSYGDMALSAAGGAADLLTANHTDEILAGATGGNAEDIRAQMDQLSRDNPGSNLAGSLAGGLIPVAGLAGRAGLALRGATTAKRAVATGALSGGAYSAADMHGQGRDITPGSVTQGALAGAVAGPLGVAAGKLFNRNPRIGDAARESRVKDIASQRRDKVANSPEKIPVNTVQKIRRDMISDQRKQTDLVGGQPITNKTVKNLGNQIRKPGNTPAIPPGFRQNGPAGPWNPPQYYPGAPANSSITAKNLWDVKVAHNDRIKGHYQSKGRGASQADVDGRASLKKATEKHLAASNPRMYADMKSADSTWNKAQSWKRVSSKLDTMTSIDDLQKAMGDPSFTMGMPKNVRDLVFEEVRKGNTTVSKVKRLIKQAFYFANPSTALFNIYRHPAVGLGNAGAMIGTKSLSAANLRKLRRRLADATMDDVSPVEVANTNLANAFAGMTGAGILNRENQ